MAQASMEKKNKCKVLHFNEMHPWYAAHILRMWIAFEMEKLLLLQHFKKFLMQDMLADKVRAA